MSKPVFFFLCQTILLSTVTTDAVAYSEDDAQSARSLEEVVVTARKREESLQDVPVAVAVVSQEQLRNNVASDLSKSVSSRRR